MLEILVVLAVAVEAVTEIVGKKVINPILSFLWKSKANGAVKAFAPLLAFCLGITAAVLGHLNAFAEYGVYLDYPAFGEVITGIMIGGGSNYVHNKFRD